MPVAQRWNFFSMVSWNRPSENIRKARTETRPNVWLMYVAGYQLVKGEMTLGPDDVAEVMRTTCFTDNYKVWVTNPTPCERSFNMCPRPAPSTFTCALSLAALRPPHCKGLH